jgi:hypothetical protein
MLDRADLETCIRAALAATTARAVLAAKLGLAPNGVYPAAAGIALPVLFVTLARTLVVAFTVTLVVTLPFTFAGFRNGG